MGSTPGVARPASPPRPERLAAVVSGVVAGVIVFHRALAYYFSQDDFLGLARAGGLAPRLTGPWRFLSHQAIFDALRPLAGLDPMPYHLVSLVSHAACVALLALFLARRVSPAAALLGAVFFAAHPALYTVLFWFSAVGDSLALLFALAALMLAMRTDRRRWLALPLFALSLLAKESTLLLPAVVALAGRFDPAARDARRRGRIGVPLGLTAVAIAYAAAFALGNAFGVREGISAGAPYAFGPGPHVLANALTYLGWTVAIPLPLARGFYDAVDPTVHPWGYVALALWLLGLASRRLRGAGWVMGGTMWLLFLIPMLGLRHHTYHYYLYAPMAGTAWCVAAAAERIQPRGRRTWMIAGAAAALLTFNGALFVRKIETMPFVLPGLRADPTVDRARIAHNVHDDLGAVTLPPGVTLLFWSPTAASLGPRGETLGGSAPVATYWERNVGDALLGGLAVRVMFPQVAEVRFVRELRPTAPNEWYAAYKPDGRVRVATSAAVDSILRAGRR
ncbi:MAG: hypothetical protein ACRENJ_04465 [Candidatus Eiseniibacteriota bacterium]